MGKKLTLSVITLTHNRAPMLTKCLGSLVGQLGSEDEIIIVDNGSTDSTRGVVLQFQTRLPIRYFTSSRVGYPALYNVAIKKSTKEVLVFLDDDCVAGKNYISAVRRAHKKHRDAVIQGQTYSLPRHNIYAEIMGDHYQNWVVSNTIEKNLLCIFDNKNLCVPRAIIKKYGLFDEILTEGSEDIELGSRYFRNGVTIIYDPAMVVHHHERDNLKGFLQQHYRIARSEAIVDDKYIAHLHIGIYNRRMFRHLISAIKRQVYLGLQGRVGDFCLHPFVLLLLFGTRTIGYMSVRGSR